MISLVSMTVWKQLANLLEKDMDSHDIWKNAQKCNIIEFLETYWKDFSVVPFKVNPLTPTLSLVVLLTDCQTILIMLVWRNWYRIN